MEDLFQPFKSYFDRLKPYPADTTQGEGIAGIESLKTIFSCIDLTSLNTTDSTASIEAFCEKVEGFSRVYPQMPNLAAVCVYPAFTSVLKARLSNLPVKRAVVSAGFPSSQTFLDLKIRETRKALDMGANEIDIVLSVGEFLEGNYEFVLEEISAIKGVMEENYLKVILETGALETPENIWEASLLAMQGGADFIKTSTGKLSPAATPEAAWVMMHAIEAWHREKKRKVGFKAAGGISTSRQACIYFHMVQMVLGEEWISPDLFRIGASRLANNLLSDIVGSREVVKYF